MSGGCLRALPAVHALQRHGVAKATGGSQIPREYKAHQLQPLRLLREAACLLAALRRLLRQLVTQRCQRCQRICLLGGQRRLGTPVQFDRGSQLLPRARRRRQASLPQSIQQRSQFAAARSMGAPQLRQVMQPLPQVCCLEQRLCLCAGNTQAAGRLATAAAMERRP